jgi:hypothetical protein
MLSALALLSLMPSFDELEAEARASGDAALMAELEAARAETADELAQLEARKNLELVDFANLVEGLAADYSTDLLTRSADFVATEVDAKGERPARCLDTLEAALRQRATQGYVDGEALEAQLREIALDLGTQE